MCGRNYRIDVLYDMLHEYIYSRLYWQFKCVYVCLCYEVYVCCVTIDFFFDGSRNSMCLDLNHTSCHSLSRVGAACQTCLLHQDSSKSSLLHHGHRTSFNNYELCGLRHDRRSGHANSGSLCGSLSSALPFAYLDRNIQLYSPLCHHLNLFYRIHLPQILQ